MLQLSHSCCRSGHLLQGARGCSGRRGQEEGSSQPQKVHWWKSRRQGGRQLGLGLQDLHGTPRPQLEAPSPSRASSPAICPSLLSLRSPTHHHRGALPSCILTSQTTAQSGAAWLFWLEVAEGLLRKGQDFLSLHEALFPRAVSGTESLNNSPNVNNLKIFLFNCFPCPAWGWLRWPARGRGRRLPGSSAGSWAVNHGAAPPPPLRSRL